MLDIVEEQEREYNEILKYMEAFIRLVIPPEVDAIINSPPVDE